MDLQKTKEWSDLVLKILSIAAIIVAGIWAYYQFKVTGTTESNIELTITTKALPYRDKEVLLLIHVHPKNIGKVAVEPTHLGVTVRDLPADLKLGEVDLEKLPKRYEPDILARYHDGYVLEPGVTYDEIVALVVPKDSMFAIRAEIDFDEDENEVDQTAVVRVGSDDK